MYPRPSSRQTTIASTLLKLSSHTVPQVPFTLTSSRPSRSPPPPTSLKPATSRYSTRSHRPHRSCPLRIRLRISTADMHECCPPQRYPSSKGDPRSHLIHGFFGPHEYTTKTAP